MDIFFHSPHCHDIKAAGLLKCVTTVNSFFKHTDLLKVTTTDRRMGAVFLQPDAVKVFSLQFAGGVFHGRVPVCDVGHTPGPWVDVARSLAGCGLLPIPRSFSPGRLSGETLRANLATLQCLNFSSFTLI